MKTLPREQANIVWDKLWNEMNSEWFKVEVLQDYTGEDKGPSLAAWMTGDRELSMQLARNEPNDWQQACQEKVERGVMLTRIHVVDYPLSDYMKWEIEIYKVRNIPLGKETVYLLDRKDIGDLELPAGDLMMFDKKYVAIGHYDESGYAATQTFYDESDDITRFLDLRKKLLSAQLVKVEA